MFKSSVNLYFSSELDSKSKIDLIKEVGYDEFYTGIYKKNETMDIISQIKYAKSLGLGITMVHCLYDEKNLNDFWKDGDIGDEIEKSYEMQINKIGEYTNNFVVHLSGSDEVVHTPIGLQRINRLLKTCEKYNINLAVENLYTENEIRYIFNNLSHPLLKICFDCGHKNFLTKNFDLLGEYGRYVSVLHIHDNNGITDEHKIIGTGNINLKQLAKQLSKYNLIYSAEIKVIDKGLDLKEVLQSNKDALFNLYKLGN